MSPAQIETTPEEHGAVGDGITDDRPALQKALDLLAAEKGGVLRLAARTYVVGPQGLNLGARVEIRGQGDDSVLKVAETETNGWLITSYFAADAVISGLKLDGNARNRTGNDSVHGGILLEGCRSCTVENCTLVNFGRRIVPPQGSLGEAILLRVKEDYRQDSTGNRITGNRILDPDGCASFGIRIWSDWTENLPADGYSRLNQDNVIQGNLIEGTRWNAIEIAGPAARANTITGNTVRNIFGHRGIEADKGAVGNTFSDNLVDGIFPGAGGAPYAAFCDQGVPEVAGKHPARLASDNVFSNNRALNGEQGDTGLAVFGFFANGSKGLSLAGLEVAGFKANPGAPKNVAGIWVAGACEDATIDRCTAKGVPIGIVLENGHPQGNISISHCELEATHRTLWLAQPAAGLEKGEVTIASNSIHCDPDTGQYAVLINAFNRVNLTGNNISGKRVYLGPSFTSQAVLKGNSLSNINDFGIYVHGGVAEITMNDISGCTNTAIEIHPDVSGCVVASNTIGPGGSA
jgi:hypothetical protein